MPLIKGKQIATGADGVATANLVDDGVTGAKLAAAVAGAGLVQDGSGNLDVGAGIGITVAADSIAVNQAFAPAWTGQHTFNTLLPTSSLTPAAAADLTTKAYVDGISAGVSWKDVVRVATAAALPAVTYANGTAGVGATLTADANGVLTVDGVATVLNNEILVKNQAAGLQNGIYKVTTEGTAVVKFVLTRRTDNDEAAEMANAAAFASEGTANADSGFTVTTDAPITMGTTAVTWTQFTGLGQVTAGAGLTKTANTLDVGAGLGITVNADDVEVNYALVGAITAVDAGDAAAAGTANTAARGDHQHAVSTGTPVAPGVANAEGTALTLARADHVHDSPAPTTSNKNLTASVTTTDNDQATATAITSTPALDSMVGVRVNGIHYQVGDGTKVSVDCYFSGDAGVTARAIAAIVATDTLRWNGSVAGFQLAASDRIDYDYIV